MKRIIGCGIVCLALAAICGPAQAGPIWGFGSITNNVAGDAAIGEAQLFVEILDAGSNQVSFLFTNIGPAASSITDVYFDDGTLLGIATIADSGDGVAFSQEASPGNLPSANDADPDFETTAGFSADSDPEVQPNGVNPDEWLKITFDLQAQGTYADVLDELADGSLRIGIHVQGFTSGGSESFVNTPVPEPATLLLLGAGLAGLGLARRRRKA